MQEYSVTEQEKARWVRIENINTWKVKIPNLHPDTIAHTKLWREYSKLCIEGLWGNDFGYYRFMPPKLFFYVNFYTIIHEEGAKQRKKIRPYCRDLEWEYAYMFLVAKGFSGFKDDDEYSCHEDILKYHKGEMKKELLHLSCIRLNGNVKKYEDPLKYCKRLHDSPKGIPLYENDAKNIMLFGARASGKLLLPTAKIRIKDGWSTMEDVKVGDKVYGLDGKLATITNKTEKQTNVNMFKLSLRDGREIECCEDHLWYVWDKNKARNGRNPYVTKSTKELYETYSIGSPRKKCSFESRYAIPVNESLQEESYNELPIHPYVLGVLLGDGGMTQTNVIITSEDQEIIDKVDSLLPEGYYVKKYKQKYAYVIARKDKSVKPFMSYLQDLGLAGKKSEHKFIPEIYKFNSPENKLELIKGLMDTDGTCDNRKSIEYYTSSKQLSDDFQEVLRSLGINCHTRIKPTHYISKKTNERVDCLDCHRTTIFTDKPIFSLERKLGYIDYEKSKLGQSKYEKTFITKIEPVGKGEGYCIEVDNPTHTYITDDYIVTHNSYFISGAALHEITFCGHSEYNEDYIKRRNKIGICVGAGRSDKSSNFIAYMTSAMNEFAISNDIGVWGDISKDDYEPCPFYREMVGEVRSGSTSPWRHEYKVRKDGRETTMGSGSFLRHVNYKDDPEAAASGRYNYNIIEEIGLVEDAPKIWESNEFTTKVGTKFGSNVGLGTSGDIEKVEGAKEIFLKPNTYNLVSYEDLWEHNGQNGMTGFFIPAYMTDQRFKDANGNTDLERAKKFYFEDLEKHKDNPVSYRAKCLHAPLLVSHMWVSANGNLLPVEEAKNREKQLLVKNVYKDLMKPCKLVFNTTSRTGVEIQYDTTLLPITNPYTTGADEDREGCIVIYKEPETIDNRSYSDQYFYVHDCYARSKNGLSLGVTYVLTNPKYSMYGFGNEIVASYIGRPRKGLDEYNTNMEKLVQLYGNCPRMLWYEANRGSDVRSHFHNKNKAFVLAFEPHYAKGRSAYEQKDAMYGFTVGNKSAKVELINWFNDWLLETMTINGQTVMNIDRIPCMYLIRQIIMFNIDEDENFDGVSAMLGFPLALKEFEKTLIVESQKKKGNPLNFFANNPKLIKSLN